MMAGTPPSTAQSQALTPTGVQTPQFGSKVSKTLRELKFASENLASAQPFHANTATATTTNVYAATASAHKLLARHGLDPTRFIDEVKFTTEGSNISSNSKQADLENIERFHGGEAKDLDAYLMHHHELIVAATIARTEEQVSLDQNMSQLFTEDWEEDKEELYRNVVGYTSCSKLSTTSNTGYQYQHAASSRAPAITEPIRFHGPSNDDDRSKQLSAGVGATIMSNPVREHAALVARWNDDAMIQNPCAELESVAAGAGCRVKYLEAVRLLGSMFGDYDHPSAQRGGAVSGEKMVVVERAKGALSFLCAQTREHIVRKVRQAALAGNTSASASGGLAQDVESYVKMDHRGIMSSTSYSSGSSLLWHQVYYCLRCGDAIAALETLQSVRMDGQDGAIEPAIMNLLHLLASSQSRTGSIWDATPCQEILAARRDVGEFYHRSKATSSRYKTGALALLSAVEQLSPSSGILPTVDDYLFASIWFAVQSGDKSSLGNGALALIAKLGKNIKTYGSAHFEKGASTKGWGYAYPLLVAQQWGAALSHLASIGGSKDLLEATHLALLISRYRGFAESKLLEDKISMDGGACRLLTSLFANYSKTFQDANPAAAVGYLVQIPDESEVSQVRVVSKQAKNQIKRLLLETRAFDVLVGRVSTNGTRKGAGILSNYFRESELSLLLADASNDALVKRNVTDAAELLSLAEKYGALISLLSRELTSLLAEDPNSETRKFWMAAALQFHTTHLTEGRTRVIEVLEQEGNVALGYTFQLVLNLMNFFDKCHAGKLEEATAVIENLNLFPKTEEEVSWKVNTFHSLDRTVQQVLPQVMLATMECLYGLYNKFKSSRRQAPTIGESVTQRLTEVSIRARLLAMFAGQIPISNDARVKIVNIEARMV